MKHKPEMMEALAAHFSKTMEEAWRDHLGKSYVQNIKSICETQEEKDEAFEANFSIFCDFLVGTTVGLLAQYGSDKPEFEEFVLEEVKEKFKRIRVLLKDRVK